MIMKLNTTSVKADMLLAGSSTFFYKFNLSLFIYLFILHSLSLLIILPEKVNTTVNILTI